MKWQKQWALEIADSKAGVGTEYQDALADCIAEADDYIVLLEAVARAAQDVRELPSVEAWVLLNNALDAVPQWVLEETE